jgi:cell division initiation protein
MTITPLDIQNIEFKSSFRGYNSGEVDSFLSKLLVDYELLYKENQKLKEDVRKMQEGLSKYKTIEDHLSATLVLAEKTAKELTENSQKESELIIEEARLKAEELEKEIEQRVYEKEKQLADLLNSYQGYKLKMLSFIEMQQRLLQEDEHDSYKIQNNDQNID